MAATDSLQFAQIIADLQTLQNAVSPLRHLSFPHPHIVPSSPHSDSEEWQDPNAAIALLTAHKTLSSTTRRRSRTSFPEQPKFDKLGRRIVTPKTPAGLSRLDSSGSFNGKALTLRNGSGKTSGNSSGVGTPNLSEEVSRSLWR
jgi:hypothetical protein